MASKKSSRKNEAVSTFDEQTFHLMFEGHSAVMLLIEPQTGVILDANQAAVDFYGYPKSKLCSMSIHEINTLAPEQAAVEHQKAFNEELNHAIFSHKLASGEERIVEIFSSPVALQERQALFSIIHDITRHKQAEKALSVEQYLMDTLMYNVPAHIYFKDRKSRFIRVNTAQAQFFRLDDPKQAVGKTDFDFFTNEHAQQAYNDEQEIIRTGQPISKEERETRHGFPDKWVSTTKLPLRDKDKKIIGTFGISVDITEHKQVEEALNESKLLFHRLIESLHQNIYAKDVDGRFIFANQRYCATEGRSLEEIVGKTDFDLHPPELAEKYRMDDLRVIENGQTLELEEEHQPLGKERFFVQVIKTPFYYSAGQPAGILGIFWDITERKQAEIELRRAQDELETAHHELQQSFEREQQLSHMDELTGINNHRSLLKLAERELNVAIRYRLPLSMMFFDIDNFKQINDTFGHAMGDQALKKIIQIVCAELRSADAIGRYGGDEFIILLPQTSAQEALSLAERIHTSIANMFMDTDKGPLTLTISIGIAQTLHSAAQPDSVPNLLLRADQAMYAAKQTGRNRTVVFSQE
jgi:diguanylate cyclase (GGDEF)-like protein/PAS domain S-box-containing protein